MLLHQPAIDDNGHTRRLDAAIVRQGQSRSQSRVHRPAIIYLIVEIDPNDAFNDSNPANNLIFSPTTVTFS